MRRADCALAGDRPGPVGAGVSGSLDPLRGVAWAAPWAAGADRPRAAVGALERGGGDFALVQRAFLRAALPDAAGGASGDGGGAGPPPAAAVALGGRAGGC